MSEREMYVYEIQKRKKVSEVWGIDSYRPWIYNDGKLGIFGCFLRQS